MIDQAMPLPSRHSASEHACIAMMSTNPAWRRLKRPSEKKNKREKNEQTEFSAPALMSSYIAPCCVLKKWVE